MSNADRCFVGDRFVYEDVEYFAGQVTIDTCTGCAFDVPGEGSNDSCKAAPPGCAEYRTIWLTKQNYITNRLMT